ncbi:MAG: hypothetical protein BWY59_01268 [Verrucomicrobia bacterium ADurb.Bin345]|nr:MAG: hypothetical protein BWY59_01268 [Verrucomicrobia bacterium ADurb.Bin345]
MARATPGAPQQVDTERPGAAARFRKNVVFPRPACHSPRHEGGLEEASARRTRRGFPARRTLPHSQRHDRRRFSFRRGLQSRRGHPQSPSLHHLQHPVRAGRRQIRTRPPYCPGWNGGHLRGPGPQFPARRGPQGASERHALSAAGPSSFYPRRTTHLATRASEHRAGSRAGRGRGRLRVLHDEARRGANPDQHPAGDPQGRCGRRRRVPPGAPPQHLPESLRCGGFRPLQERGASRPQTGQHHGRPVRRGAGHGLGACEDTPRDVGRGARRTDGDAASTGCHVGGPRPAPARHVESGAHRRLRRHSENHQRTGHGHARFPGSGTNRAECQGTAGHARRRVLSRRRALCHPDPAPDRQRRGRERTAPAHCGRRYLRAGVLQCNGGIRRRAPQGNARGIREKRRVAPLPGWMDPDGAVRHHHEGTVHETRGPLPVRADLAARNRGLPERVYLAPRHRRGLLRPGCPVPMGSARRKRRS